VSSVHLAAAGGLTPAQVRKDLSFFGSFGVRGRGYDVHVLRGEIARILGLDRKWSTVVVGAGRLGSALASYPRFSRQGFRIVALFDNDSERLGTRIGDAEILPATELESYVRQHEVSFGILTTPASAAQETADRLVAGGIRGILNFTPTVPEVPETVHLRNVNLTIELEGLSFAIREAEIREGPQEGESD
jgi:redox-sensing transcriptional repressor